MTNDSGNQAVPPSSGIEGQLDAGLAESDRLGDEADTDLQADPGTRPDPDDPKAAIQQSVAKSKGED